MTSPPRPISRLIAAVLLPVLAWCAGAQAQGVYPRDTLAGQLQIMGERQGFTVRGLDKLGETKHRSVSGSAKQRIRQLLAGFDYVIVHRESGHVRRLIIIGVKGESPALPQEPASAAADDSAVLTEEQVLPTRRDGTHHLVQAVLVGAQSRTIGMELMVDTGASLLVLPKSRLGALGIAGEGLETRTLQTAKGTMEAVVASLASVNLGKAKVDSVEAAFVDDEQLGSHGLLGMNVLSRFVFILDDDKNQLTLLPGS